MSVGDWITDAEITRILIEGTWKWKLKDWDIRYVVSYWQHSCTKGDSFSYAITGSVFQFVYNYHHQITPPPTYVTSFVDSYQQMPAGSFLFSSVRPSEFPNHSPFSFPPSRSQLFKQFFCCKQQLNRFVILLLDRVQRHPTDWHSLHLVTRVHISQSKIKTIFARCKHVFCFYLFLLKRIMHFRFHRQ